MIGLDPAQVRSFVKNITTAPSPATGTPSTPDPGKSGTADVPCVN
jgi:hypothetical protein